jgi:hypothetical protein
MLLLLVKACLTVAQADVERIRNPSPNRLKPRTVQVIARPGKRITQGAVWSTDDPSLIIEPQVAVGGRGPSPRKLKVASARIAVVIESMLSTSTDESAFGRMCRSTILGALAPVAHAATTCSRFLNDRTSDLSLHDPGEAGHRRQADGDHHVRQPGAQRGHDRQREQQSREHEHRVSQAHDHGARQTATEPGGQSLQGAQHAADEHRHDPDRERQRHSKQRDDHPR